MVWMNDTDQVVAFRKRLGKKRKLALVLAGGGITGVTYEIGALQALDRFFCGDFSVNDFDIIIGLSAGAFVGSLLANDVTPSEMFFALGEQAHTIDAINQRDIFYPNFSEVIARPLSFPLRLILSGIGDLLRWRELNPYAYMESLNEILPSGIFTNERIEAYLRKNLTQPGRTNDFRQLNKELYIAATDLDTGRRIVFGTQNHRDVPISKAVQASTALPLFYRPVEINGREYIDGAIRKSLHIDVALKRGADLVICINPLVPLNNDLRKRAIPLLGGMGDHLSQRGMSLVAYQVMRIMVHSRISSGLQKYRAQYPDVDILLIEPRANDYQMFFYNIMNYSARLSIARHGYEETLETLLRRFNHFKERLHKHGIEICRQGIQSDLQKLRRLLPSSFDEIQHLLYPTHAHSRMAEELHRALDKLEQHLGFLSAEKQWASSSSRSEGSSRVGFSLPPWPSNRN
ncbi:MAG: patatin-like phospholipase family protein [Acidobacteria bacterium]|nr:patatin-like phospholipase family protein [Acidobacteriota bacterium]